MEKLGEALGVGTVLDGEVVRNRSWGRDIFMVFDCMSVGGASCALEPFSRRLVRLQKVTIVHVRCVCLCVCVCVCVCVWCTCE